MFKQTISLEYSVSNVQKQPSRCSENMQQIYRRTPMPKCAFNINKNRSENGIPEKSDLGPGTSTDWTPELRTPKCLGGTQDPKSGTCDPGLPIFHSFNRLLYTYYFTLYLLQNFALISLLTYFMANIQKQPLRWVINFKKLWAVT